MILVSTAFVLLAAPMVWYARVTAQDIAGMAGPDLYKGGMEWLSKNAEPGELIVNTDWDDFPKLFFYNPRLAWVSGLDPTYLLDRDRKLAELHGKITIARDLSDEEVANLGPLIRDNFCVGEGDQRRCARYVFTDHEHEDSSTTRSTAAGSTRSTRTATAPSSACAKRRASPRPTTFPARPVHGRARRRQAGRELGALSRALPRLDGEDLHARRVVVDVVAREYVAQVAVQFALEAEEATGPQQETDAGAASAVSTAGAQHELARGRDFGASSCIEGEQQPDWPSTCA